ncbi:hypothetical protein Barb6XT_02796 [Bacteroidales bacterium Barb6XT]|nr:hypothetical protein Barb6XT_02796 [Bacteroidales bacterium Barb6XT]
MIFEELEQSIRLLYPKCPIKRFKDVCIVSEAEPNATVKGLSFNIPESLLIGNELIKSLSGFFENSDRIFRKDCDGIVLLEYNGKSYCLLIELKSAFDTKDIDKARKQILSTYIKLNMSLMPLADYNKDDFEFIGIIVSKEPTGDCLKWIRNINMLSDTDPKKKLYIFPIQLYSEKQKVIHYDFYLREKGYRLSPNCMYEKMKYCHVAVPPDSSIYKADIAKFL